MIKNITVTIKKKSLLFNSSVQKAFCTDEQAKYTKLFSPFSVQETVVI